MQSLEDPGSVHQDGDDGQAGVEDDQRWQDVWGEEVAAARSLDWLFVF